MHMSVCKFCVFVQVCVSICVCVHVCVFYVCVNMYFVFMYMSCVHAWVFDYLGKCACVCESERACARVCVYRFICAHMSVGVCLCRCICVHARASRLCVDVSVYYFVGW